MQTPKVLSIEKQIKAVDKKISFYKKKKNTKMVKALQAKKAQLISSLKKQKGIESPKTDEVVKKSENKSVDIEGPIGTWLNNGHTSFRVIKTFFQNTDPRGQKAPQGTRFFVVDVEIKNADPFTAIYGGNYHKATLIDSNKVYYMEENAKNPDNWADNDSERELMPNESFETAYVFTIPEEAVPEKFIFDVSSADKYPVMKVLLK